MDKLRKRLVISADRYYNKIKKKIRIVAGLFTSDISKWKIWSGSSNLFYSLTWFAHFLPLRSYMHLKLMIVHVLGRMEFATDRVKYVRRIYKARSIRIKALRKIRKLQTNFSWDHNSNKKRSELSVLYAARHYFNDIPYTYIPCFLGWTVFLCMFFMIVWLKKSLLFIPIGLLCILFLCFIRWFSDMYIESSLRGRYGRKIRAALCCGFCLFLFSEIMLFGGFFWAYFDRFFNTGYTFEGYWIPAGIDIVEFSRWPFVGTVILVTSGYFANHSYYLLKAGDFLWHLFFGYAAIISAISFLCIQLLEYNESLFTISDSVYGSFFYLLTGFHGFHVTVGFLFLVEQYERSTSILEVEYPDWTLNRCNTCVYTFFKKTTFSKKLRFFGTQMRYPSITHENVPSTQCFLCGRLYNLYVMFDRSIQLYNRQRNTGIVLSIIYWHFVDIIWIFLYYFVYVQAYRYM